MGTEGSSPRTSGSGNHRRRVGRAQPHAGGAQRLRRASWQREELRTTLWLVPTLLVVASVALFAVTFSLDISAYHKHLSYPSWIRTLGADAAREILIAIAAAVITVVGCLLYTSRCV